MLTTRLQSALQRIEEISAEEQDELAALIEDALAPAPARTSYAGVLAGLLPDDAKEQVLRLRREAPPSPPLAEQLRGLTDDQGQA